MKKRGLLMAVLGSVRAALEGRSVPEWRRELAESLASAMDESPSASTAKELRLLMDELLDGGVGETGDVSDDLAAKRAARRRAASGS